jgi:hypothetical protein
MATPDVYQRAVERWRARGVPLLAPCSRDELGATFETLGCPLSEDVAQLYGATGGFVDYEVDGGLWSLWSLARLRRENEDNPQRGDLVIFADFLISSHTYGLHYEDETVSSVYILEGGDRMAESLERFLELYLSDPDSVWAFHSG